MNKKQLAKLLIKHPEIKALYESREFDTSTLNKLIAKEILKEADSLYDKYPETEDMAPTQLIDLMQKAPSLDELEELFDLAPTRNGVVNKKVEREYVASKARLIIKKIDQLKKSNEDGEVILADPDYVDGLTPKEKEDTAKALKDNEQEIARLEAALEELKPALEKAEKAKAAAESEPEITPDSNEVEPTSDQEPTPTVSLNASGETAVNLRKIGRLLQRLSNTDAGKTIGSTLAQLKKAKQEPVIPELEEYEAASTVLVPDGDGNVEINPEIKAEIEEELPDETIPEVVIPIETLDSPEVKEELETLEKEVETIMSGLETKTVTSKIADQLKKRASTTAQSDGGEVIDNVFRPAQALQVLEQMLQQYQSARTWNDLEELHPTKIKKLQSENKLMDFNAWAQANLGEGGAITKIFETKIENFKKQIETAQNDPNSLRDAEGEAVLDAEQVDIDGIGALSNAIENSMSNDASGEDEITGDVGGSGFGGQSSDDVLSAVLGELGSSIEEFPTLMANDRFKSLLSLSIADQSGESNVDDGSETTDASPVDSDGGVEASPDSNDSNFEDETLREALSGIYLEEVEPEETNDTEEGSPMSIEDATNLRDEIQRLQDLFSRSENENVKKINVEDLAKQAFGDIPQGAPGTDPEAEPELSGDAVEEGQAAADEDAQREQIQYQELCAAFIPAMDNFFSTAQATRLGFMEQFLLESQSKMLWGLIADLTKVALKDEQRAYSNKPETDAAGLTGAESPEASAELEEAAMDRFFNRDKETVEISDEDKISLKTELKALLQALRYAKSMVSSYEKNMTQVSVDPGLDGSALKERLDKYLPLLQKSIAKIVERANEALVRATKLNAKEPEATNDDEPVDAKPEGRPATTDPQPSGTPSSNNLGNDPQPGDDELWEMMVASSNPVYPIMEKDSRDDIIKRVDKVYNSMRDIYTPVGEGEDSEGLRGFMETGDRARAIPQAEKMLEIATQEDFIKLFPGGRIGEGGMPATVNDAIETMNREIKNLVLIMRDVVTLASKNEIPHPKLSQIVDSLWTISKTLENSFGAKMMISSETLKQIETRLAEEDKNKSLTNSPSTPGATSKAGQLASDAIASLKKFMDEKGWGKLLDFLDSLGYFDNLPYFEGFLDKKMLEKLITDLPTEDDALKEMIDLEKLGEWLETIDERQLAALRKLTDILKKQALQEQEEMAGLQGLETQMGKLNSTITPEQLRSALKKLGKKEYNLLNDLFSEFPEESAAFIANSINGLLKSKKDADDQAMPPANMEIDGDDDEDPIDQLSPEEQQAWQSIRSHLVESVVDNLVEIFEQPEEVSEVIVEVENIEKAFRSKFSRKTTPKDLKNLTESYYWSAGLDNIIDELRPYLPADLFEKIYGIGTIASGKTKRLEIFKEKINQKFIESASRDDNMVDYNKGVGKLLRFAKKVGQPFSQSMKAFSKDIIRDLPPEITNKTKSDAQLAMETLWTENPLNDMENELNSKRKDLQIVFAPQPAYDYNKNFNSVPAEDFLKKINVYLSGEELDFTISNFAYRTKNKEIPRKILPLLGGKDNKGKFAWIYYVLADTMRQHVREFSGKVDSLRKNNKEALLFTLFLMKELDPYSDKPPYRSDSVPVGKEEFESIVEAMGENQSELMKFSYNFYDLMLDPSKIDDEPSSEPPADTSGPEQPESGTEPESPEPDAEAGEESDQAKKEFEEYANKSEVARGLTEIISGFEWENEQEKNSALSAAKTYLTSYVENALDEEGEIDVGDGELEGLKNYISNLISESKKSDDDDDFEDIDDDFAVQAIEANLWAEPEDSEDEETTAPKNSQAAILALSNRERQILQSKEGLITAISDFAKTNFEKLVADYKKRKEEDETAINPNLSDDPTGMWDTIADAEGFADIKNKFGKYVSSYLFELHNAISKQTGANSNERQVLSQIKEVYGIGLRDDLEVESTFLDDNPRFEKAFKKFRMHFPTLMKDYKLINFVSAILTVNSTTQSALDAIKGGVKKEEEEEIEEWKKLNGALRNPELEPALFLSPSQVQSLASIASKIFGGDYTNESIEAKLKPIIEAMLKQHYKH